jgi:uncharacterized protein (DUF885 family)
MIRIYLLAFSLIMMSFNTVLSADNPDEKQFERYKKMFIQGYWKLHPTQAIYAGNHYRDSILTIPDSNFFKVSQKLIKFLNDSLKIYNPDQLSANSKTDFYMMRDRLDADLWYITKYRSHEWNPAYYNVSGEFAEILSSQTESLNQRLRNISGRLKNVEAYYKAGIANLKNPVIEHTDLAILQNEGGLEVFEKQIPDSILASTLSDNSRNLLNERLEKAKTAIKNYVSHLKNLRSGMSEENSRSFRLGKELYQEKFHHDIQSSYDAEGIYKVALERKEEIHKKMAGLAKKLWSKYMDSNNMPDDDRAVIRAVIDKISLKHVQPDSFMLAIEKQIPDLTEFVNRKKLLYLDPSKPLKIRRTPGYMEGSGAGASISSPGPYDKEANTYYNVSPLTGYTPENAESYLREYNYYILQILNIHEAIPGHYAQLVYSNQSPSLIKSILENGAMVEGWAVYAERMMLEEGYGNNEPEMWLMYYKWHLRSICNTILDYSVHVMGWSKEDAVQFLTGDAFQQQAEADGKWRRVKLTQVQLCSYFTGYTEIYNLREELKKQKDFNLKSFHEQFLSYGSAPVKYIRELMISKTK